MESGKETKKKTFKDLFEADQKRTDEALKEFDIDAFSGEVDKDYSLSIPKVGIVKYKLLSYDELKALNKRMKKQGVTSLEEQGLHVIAEMMFKADGKTTVDKLRKIGGGKAAKLLTELGEASGFL